MPSTGIFFSLLTLTFLEIILGIDNLVFLTVATAKLPEEKQKMARRLGLTFALITRLLLLALVFWIAQLTQPLFTISGFNFSIRDLLLIGGGLFLLVKATQEIHHEMEPEKAIVFKKKSPRTLVIVAQIGILDIIFSLDSVFTAIGLTPAYWIMATAIILAILAMIFLSEPLSKIINQHPTIKMLALSFLLLIGSILIADGFHYSIPRGYLYFSIIFSIFVEVLNSFSRKKNSNH